MFAAPFVQPSLYDRAMKIGRLVPLALCVAAAGCSVDMTPADDSPVAGSGAGAGAPTNGGGGDGTDSNGGGGSPPSSGGEAPGGSGEGGSGGAAAPVDLDLDGIADDDEAQIAATYRPFLSIHPEDECTLGGIVYRVRPHPADASLIHIVYDHLFETDCGFPSHAGDNEAFGVTVDPSIPPPEGILAIVAIGHQGTLCQQVSECGACGETCTTASLGGASFPVVFSSQNKHAGYVGDGCGGAANCFDSCQLAAASADPPMVNAGEPEAPLVSNLTTEGFINQANGWSEMELFDVDPWDTETSFGGAGNIAGDLVDEAFIPCAE